MKFVLQGRPEFVVSPVRYNGYRIEYKAFRSGPRPYNHAIFRSLFETYSLPLVKTNLRYNIFLNPLGPRGFVVSVVYCTASGGIEKGHIKPPTAGTVG